MISTLLHIFRGHWHFLGHRVPGVCCGERCPHHRPGCQCHDSGADS